MDVVKYKTELCRNYSTYGYCSYSLRCQFAHGFEELRCRTRHPKYKTEFCRNFLSGFCKYGTRCQFLHHSSNPTVNATQPLESNPTAGTKSFSSLMLHFSDQFFSCLSSDKYACAFSCSGFRRISHPSISISRTRYHICCNGIFSKTIDISLELCK